MAIDIPGWLQHLELIAGMEWPEGNEDKMWDLGEDWRTAARELESVISDIEAAKSASIKAYPAGEGFTEMVNAFDSLLQPGKEDRTLKTLAKYFKDTGDGTYQVGTEIEYAKLMYISSLALLAAEMAASLLAGPFKLGLDAAAIAATRIACRFIASRLMSAVIRAVGKIAANAVVKFIFKHIMIDTAIGTMQEFAIQQHQVNQGHRNNVDMKQVGLAALSSAAGGAAAGPLAEALGKRLMKGFGPDNPMGFGRQFLNNQITGTAAGLTGALAGYAVTIPFGAGPFDYRMLTAGASNGALTAGSRTLGGKAWQSAAPSLAGRPDLGTRLNNLFGDVDGPRVGAEPGGTPGSGAGSGAGAGGSNSPSRAGAAGDGSSGAGSRTQPAAATGGNQGGSQATQGSTSEAGQGESRSSSDDGGSTSESRSDPTSSAEGDDGGTHSQDGEHSSSSDNSASNDNSAAGDRSTDEQTSSDRGAGLADGAGTHTDGNGPHLGGDPNVIAAQNNGALGGAPLAGADGVHSASEAPQTAAAQAPTTVAAPAAAGAPAAASAPIAAAAPAAGTAGSPTPAQSAPTAGEARPAVGADPRAQAPKPEVVDGATSRAGVADPGTAPVGGEPTVRAGASDSEAPQPKSTGESEETRQVAGEEDGVAEVDNAPRAGTPDDAANTPRPATDPLLVVPLAGIGDGGGEPRPSRRADLAGDDSARRDPDNDPSSDPDPDAPLNDSDDPPPKNPAQQGLEEIKEATGNRGIKPPKGPVGEAGMSLRDIERAAGGRMHEFPAGDANQPRHQGVADELVRIAEGMAPRDIDSGKLPRALVVAEHSVNGRGVGADSYVLTARPNGDGGFDVVVTGGDPAARPGRLPDGQGEVRNVNAVLFDGSGKTVRPSGSDTRVRPSHERTIYTREGTIEGRRDGETPKQHKWRVRAERADQLAAREAARGQALRDLIAAGGDQLDKKTREGLIRDAKLAEWHAKEYQKNADALWRPGGGRPDGDNAPPRVVGSDEAPVRRNGEAPAETNGARPPRGENAPTRTDDPTDRRDQDGSIPPEDVRDLARRPALDETPDFLAETDDIEEGLENNTYQTSDGKWHHVGDPPGTYRNVNFRLCDSTGFIKDWLNADYRHLAQEGAKQEYRVVDPDIADRIADVAALRAEVQVKSDAALKVVNRHMAEFGVDKLGDIASADKVRAVANQQRQQIRDALDAVDERLRNSPDDPALQRQMSELFDKLNRLKEFELNANKFNGHRPALVDHSKTLGELGARAFGLDPARFPGAVLLSPFHGDIDGRAVIDGANTLDVVVYVPGVDGAPPTLVSHEAKGVGSRLGGSKIASAEQGSPEYYRRTLKIDNNLQRILSETPEQMQQRGIDPESPEGKALIKARDDILQAHRDGTLQFEYHLVHADKAGKVTVSQFDLVRDGALVRMDNIGGFDSPALQSNQVDASVPQADDTPSTRPDDPDDAARFDADQLGVPDTDDWSALTPEQVGERLQQHLRDVLGNPDFEVFGFDSAEVNPEVAREYARAMVDLVERGPAVDLRRIGIGELPTGVIGMSQPRIDHATGRLYTDSIVLSQDHARDAEHFRRRMQIGVDNNRFAAEVMNRPVFAVIAHEYGHALDYAGQQSARHHADDVLARSYADDTTRDPSQSYDDWLRQLSGYSFDGDGRLRPGEALPEAFAADFLRSLGGSDDPGPVPVRALRDLLTDNALRPPDSIDWTLSEDPDRVAGPDEVRDSAPDRPEPDILVDSADDEWSRRSPAEVGEHLQNRIREITGSTTFRTFGFDESVHPAMARELARAMVDMHNLHPQADVRSIGIGETPAGHVALASSDRNPDGSLHTRSITFSAQYFAARPDLFENLVRRGSGNGFYTPSLRDRAVYGFAVHEFGHALDYAGNYKKTRLRADTDLFNHFFRNDLGEPNRDGYHRWLAGELSGYSLNRETGALNAPEALAEAFREMEATRDADGVLDRDAVSPAVRILYDTLFAPLEAGSTSPTRRTGAMADNPDRWHSEASDEDGRADVVGESDATRLGAPTDEWSNLTPRETGEQLRDRVRELTGNDRFEVSGFDRAEVNPEMASEYARGIVDMFERFPTADVRRVSIGDLPDGMYAQTLSEFGIRGWHAKEIIFNATMSADPDLFQRLHSANVRIGWFADGVDRPAYAVAVHEFGHVLDSTGNGYARRNLDSVLQAHYMANDLGERNVTAYRMWLRENLSGYSLDANGLLNVGEALPEAFAVVQTLGRDNVTEPVRVIYDLLEQAVVRQANRGPIGRFIDSVRFVADNAVSDSAAMDSGHAHDLVRPDDGQPDGWMYRPTDPIAAGVREILSHTTSGRDVLAIFRDTGAIVRFTDSGDTGVSADSFNGRTMEIGIDTRDRDQLTQASELVRAAELVRAVLDGRTEVSPSRIREVGQDEYVAARARVEADAFGRRAEFHREAAALGYDPLGGALHDPVDSVQRRMLEDTYLRAVDEALRGDPADLASAREAGTRALLGDARFGADDALTSRPAAEVEWAAARDIRTAGGMSEYRPNSPAAAREAERLMREQAAVAREMARVEADFDRIADRLISGFNLPADELPTTRPEMHALLAERVDRIQIWNGESNIRVLGELAAQHTRAADERARIITELEVVVARDSADVRAGVADPGRIRIHGDESGVLHVFPGADDAPAARPDADRPPPRFEQGDNPLTLTEHAELTHRQTVRALGNNDHGTWAAHTLERLGVEVRYSTEPSVRTVRMSDGRYQLGVDGGYDPTTNSVVLRSDSDPSVRARELIRAARLAEQFAEDGAVLRLTLPRDEFVDVMMSRMAEAYALMYSSDADHSGVPDLSAPDVDDLKRAYAEAYDHALKYAEKTYWKSGVVKSFPLYHRAAFRAGVRAVSLHLNDTGPLIDGQRPADHFRSTWDRANGLRPEAPPTGDIIADSAHADSLRRHLDYAGLLADEIVGLRTMRDLGGYVPLSPAETVYTEAFDKAHAKAERAQRRNPDEPPPDQVAHEAGRKAVHRYLDRIGLENAEVALDVVRAAGSDDSRWGYPKAPSDSVARPELSNADDSHQNRTGDEELVRKALDTEFDDHPHPQRLSDRVALYPADMEPDMRPRLVLVAEPGEHVDALHELAMNHPEFTDVLWDRSHTLDYRAAALAPGGVPTTNYLSRSAAEGSYRHPNQAQAVTEMLSQYLRYRAEGQTSLGFEEWLRQLGPDAFYTPEDVRKARGTHTQNWYADGRLREGFIAEGHHRVLAADGPLDPTHPAEVAHRLMTRQVPLPTGDLPVRPSHHMLEVFGLGAAAHIGVMLEPDGRGNWRVPAPTGFGDDSDVLARHFEGLSAPTRKQLVDRIESMLNDGSADLADRSKPRGRFGRFVDRMPFTSAQQSTPARGETDFLRADEPAVDAARVQRD
ncbi:WXG100-like domain-containing protein, partial [Nocardia salmonicida]